jgi:DNA-binding CsgD family transcriptional regulator
MWSERRAEAAERELTVLADAGLDPTTTLEAAADVVGSVVPYDATCWATVDPSSQLFTGSLTISFDPSAELERRFAEIEAAGDDVHPFRGLMATGASGTARLSDSAREVVAASPRAQEIYRPLGFGAELRTAFAVDGRCWAVAGLLRAGTSPDFEDREVAFLEVVGARVAAAVRAAVARSTAAAPPGGDGPAVVVLDRDARIMSATALGEDRLRALSDERPRSATIALRSMLGAIRSSGAEVARARVRCGDGTWMSLSASPLLGSADGEASPVAVTIEPITDQALTSLLLDAHGLSAREREVCGEVLGGRSTAEIAQALFISAHTVQDHLKAIFDKTGVRSRRELVAHLRSGGAPTPPRPVVGDVADP